MTDQNDQIPETTVDRAEEPTPAPAAPTGAELGWPDVKSGMQVRVHQLIKEVNAKGEEKERTQIFEGLVIKRRGGVTPGASITVRKQSFGVWVEKIFPVHLPEISKIEIMKAYKTRRSKLGYLRNPRAKRLKEIKKDAKK